MLKLVRGDAMTGHSGLTLLAILLWLPAAGAVECRLKVGWEPYAPYTYADDNGRVTGADIEIISAAADQAGCALEFRQLPWARILREIETGTLDVSTSTSLTPERSEWAWFSQSYRQTDMAVYVRKGETGRYRLESLEQIPAQQFRLGVIVDYFYGEDIDRLITDPSFTPWVDGATDYRTSIVKLINGRIDGYLVEDVTVMAAELDAVGLSGQVERYPLPVPGEKLHFMFSKISVDKLTVDKVNAALSAMRSDGRLQAIIDLYQP